MGEKNIRLSQGVLFLVGIYDTMWGMKYPKAFISPVTSRRSGIWMFWQRNPVSAFSFVGECIQPPPRRLEIRTVGVDVWPLFTKLMSLLPLIKKSDCRKRSLLVCNLTMSTRPAPKPAPKVS